MSDNNFDTEFKARFRFQTPNQEGRIVAEKIRSGTPVSVKALLSKMFPNQNRRMEQLKEIVRYWAWVVGPVCAKSSAPYDLVGTTLCVAADSSRTRAQLFMTKGNIQRKLKERWNINFGELRVTAGPPPVKPSVAWQRPRRRHPRVTVTSQDVEAKLKDCPEKLKLVPDAAEALAHFRAFYEKRFPDNRD